MLGKDSAEINCATALGLKARYVFISSGKDTWKAKLLPWKKTKLKPKQPQNQPEQAHKNDIIEEYQFIDNNERMAYYFIPIILNIITKKQTYLHIICETAK